MFDTQLKPIFSRIDPFLFLHQLSSVPAIIYLSLYNCNNLADCNTVVTPCNMGGPSPDKCVSIVTACSSCYKCYCYSSRLHCFVTQVVLHCLYRLGFLFMTTHVCVEHLSLFFMVLEIWANKSSQAFLVLVL